MDIAGAADLKALGGARAHFAAVGKTAFHAGAPSDRLDYFSPMPSAKSVLSFGISYNQDIEEPKEMGKRAKMAKMAYGKDYHRVLGKIALSFVDALKQESGKGIEAKVFVDTGPVSDKMAAYAAGIGFIGKNSLIVNRELGSYLFLGTILVSEEFAPSLPLEQDGCRGCGECVKRCPTGALDSGFDYEKCVSYQSQMGALSPKAAGAGYLYGCDECQKCCPWNKGKHACTVPDFQTGADSAYPLLDSVLSMDKPAFREKFGQSSAGWRGLGALARNAAAIKAFRGIK
jgi:epoxyqueuosine reductase